MQCLALHPPPLNHPTGCPRREGSESQKQLKKDVDNQKHLVYKPKELHETFDEHMQFPFDVFCEHIYQEEEGKRVKKSYRLSRKRTRKRRIRMRMESSERSLLLPDRDFLLYPYSCFVLVETLVTTYS
jgi:hypothetical protein